MKPQLLPVSIQACGCFFKTFVLIASVFVFRTYVVNTDVGFGDVARRRECWANAVTTGTEAAD